MAKRDGENGSEQSRARGFGTDPEDARLKARLEQLGDALEAHDEAAEPKPTGGLGDGSIGSAMSLGFRVLTEFVAAVVVGALIGWQIDVWTGTAPIFLLLFLVLGTVAGFVNIYRIATKPTGPSRGP
jgi:ATP synthase protein I